MNNDLETEWKEEARQHFRWAVQGLSEAIAL